MKLQQLRFLLEVVDSGLNVTVAAERLFTSQPGVSKQIRQLEDELGLTIFERSGKRFTGLTAAGSVLVKSARRVLLEAENFRKVAEELRDEEAVSLTVATTHAQARYVLPRVVAEFTRLHPRVRLSIRESEPMRIAEILRRGDADIGIATEALAQAEGVISIPAYQWHHNVIAPEGHPVTREVPLTLSRLASYPLITYDPAFSGRGRVDAAFARAGIQPNLVLTAVGSDVIKTYVALGMGVGIIAEMACDPDKDTGLVSIPAGSLFGANTTRVAFRQGTQPRRMAVAFAELLSPSITPDLVRQSGGEDPGFYEI